MAKVKEIRITEYMRLNPNGSHCSRCGDSVPTRGGTVASMCWFCTFLASGLYKADYFKDEVAKEQQQFREQHHTDCPDCGSPRPRGRRRGRCSSCQKKHDKVTAKQRKRDAKGNG